MIQKKEPYYYLNILYLFIYLSVCAIKAYSTSMTCDESATYMQFCHKPFLQWFVNMDLWSMANNHLLNTLLTTSSTTLLGVHEWSIRLPNVIASALFLIVINKISIALEYQKWQQLCFLICASSAPLLIDFFTVCRGYGLHVTCCAWAIYYLILLQQKCQIKHSIALTLCCMLAVYANFIAITFFICVGLSIAIIAYNNSWEKVFTLKIIALFISGGLLCMASIAKIIVRLQEIGEFKWGTKSIFETVKSFKNELFYGHYGPDAYLVIVALFMILFLGCIFILLRKRTSAIFVPICMTILMLVIPILLNILFDAAYPDGRKTVLYFFLFGMSAFIVLQSIPYKSKIITVCFTIVFSIHGLQCYNYRQIREWYFDESTKAVAYHINATKAVQNPTISCHWLFMPSLLIYNTDLYHFTNATLTYHKEIDTSAIFDYYYASPEDTAVLMHNYKIDTSFPIKNYGILLKKK
jgi:hypothetical protein